MCTHLTNVLNPLQCRIGHFIVPKCDGYLCSGCMGVKRRVLPKRPAEVLVDVSTLKTCQADVPTVTGVIVLVSVIILELLWEIMRI